MRRVVVDANVCLNWFLPTDKEDQVAYAKAFAACLKREEVSLHVPVHFDLEVAGPLLRSFRSRSGGISEKQLNAAMAEMDALPLNFHALGMGFRQLGDLARAYGLSIYDTPYLNLARAFGFSIATRDRGLLSAAKTWGVEVWSP